MINETVKGAYQIPVLVVEDDEAIRRLLRAAVHDTEFKSIEASTGMKGLAEATVHKPELVLLDLGLPDIDGVAFVQELRTWSNVPIIVVSAQGDEGRKVLALESGADDYVTKPFSVNELLARMRTAWRRVQTNGLSCPEPVLEVGELKIDISARVVTLAGKPVYLTPIEYKLLVCLAKHVGKVVTQQQILTTVWGDEYAEESQYLRIYIGYLRKKLEADPSNPTLILTQPRIGYRMVG